MRRSAAEKMEIIRLVERADLPVRVTLRQLGIPRSTFYGWYQRYFVSESSVYRILKAADLITSPAYVLMSAADAFKNSTTRVHEMWQTDFT